MPPKERKQISEQAMVLTNFECTPVMSTYLVTIAITGLFPSYSTQKDNIKITWFKRHEEEQVDVILRTTIFADRFLKKYTDNLWQNLKIHVVTHPNFPSNAVGAWGFIVFRDFLYQPTIHFPGRKIEIWKEISSQLTRQCIESLVSPIKWSHQWLNHAFATYLSYKIAGKIIKRDTCRRSADSLDLTNPLYANKLQGNDDHLIVVEYGKDVMMQLFVVQVLQPALHNDDELNVPPVKHKHDPFYSSLIHKK
ncbi:PREDICTED: leucyl-cystinyl aminopeptidase-like, partial [Dinoponera quadriceps]|uniref:Leucyl-cystinyl aminopeptidase-like n=1 Tax=Dinoponera quadriceps TaxID=609295 RepID=A0A6P3Y3M1_DINQU